MEKVFSALTSKFDDLKAWLASEIGKISGAQSELSTVKAALEAANGSISAANATIEDLTSKLQTAQELANTQGTEIKELQEKLAKSDNRATEVLAGQGLTGSEVPSAQKAEPVSVDSLRKRLVASTDPKEKYALSQAIKDLISKKN